MKTRWKLHPSTWNILGIQRPRLIIGVGSGRNASERSAVAVNCIYHLPLLVWGFLPTVCRCGRIAAFVRLVVGGNRRLIRPKLSCDRSPRLRGLRRNERCVGRLKGILWDPRLGHSRTSWGSSSFRNTQRSCMSSRHRTSPSTWSRCRWCCRYCPRLGLSFTPWGRGPLHKL